MCFVDANGHRFHPVVVVRRGRCAGFFSIGLEIVELSELIERAVAAEIRKVPCAQGKPA
jgi:hypothetical protein